MKKIFALTPIALAVILSGCDDDSTVNVSDQANVASRTVNMLTVDGYQFKDLNKNGELDIYEDWRNSVSKRIDDLVSQMTLEEKVGMMLIDTLNALGEGSVSDFHAGYVQDQKMNRFIFRNPVLTQDEVDAMSPEERNPTQNPTGFGSSAPISPKEAAIYMNTMQEMAEKTRLGIPVLFKSNARNHNDPNAKPGINVSAGAFSEWPKEAGLAATQDMDLIAEFSGVMQAEWNAIGLRGMYGYMADLATEPRWYRVHETFTENSELASNIITTLVENLQGKEVNDKSIVLTMKHFPGGGPQFLGLDPHYIAGQHQTYPGGETTFNKHLAPFEAAVNAGVASLMPYYGVVGGSDWTARDGDSENNTPLGVGTDKTTSAEVQLEEVLNQNNGVLDTKRVAFNKYNNDTDAGDPVGNVGIAFSKGILQDLLRDQLGFQGVINSDTGIIGESNQGLDIDSKNMQNNRAWGLQDKTKQQQLITAIDAGTDVLSGFHENAEIRSLVENGLVEESRIDESVKRLLKVQFELGLFEDPYVDEDKANAIVGSADKQEKAKLAQRKAVVLLKNETPASASAPVLPLATTTNGSSTKLFTLGVDVSAAEQAGFSVTKGDNTDGAKVADASSSDYALIRVRVTNKNTGWLVFGGSSFDEVSALDFTTMAQSNTWEISPSLDDIKAVMSEVGAENTVLSVYFRQPFVMDDASGLKDSGAILATFGSKDEALMDVITGKFNPSGKLPFALAKTAQQIIDQDSDAEGYPDANGNDASLYPFGYGLSYSN
ncbi:glycoside hydrolase family 3 N-terminal domain-containing protein [Vibrio sp. SCSIO 43136]|uniref:glycoside hydrolase family 3 protein n=1 Tax=Vibrio sp. SCSIO 43136 TaxID=2819101 RepID=UPI002074DF16|nr:glycoside hydrolase family 3 N-terminal domain-containing protein [Vibrio sp. SCSIO 43136]USD66373.1 glycoside hydrolase family 3 C-terminal domain-containing protein [Vibrio sp. SCSIO 43136]